VKPVLTPATMPLPSVTADFSPALASLHGLDGVNFFLAGVLAGFGPHVAVYLADQNWPQEKIGFVLSVGALAGRRAHDKDHSGASRRQLTAHLTHNEVVDYLLGRQIPCNGQSQPGSKR